jgi:hypothetical protein
MADEASFYAQDFAPSEKNIIGWTKNDKKNYKTCGTSSVAYLPMRLLIG